MASRPLQAPHHSTSSNSSLSSTCNAPRLKLCYLHRAKLFSLPPSSQLTFSQLLSLVAQAFPETNNAGAPHRPDPSFTHHIQTDSRIELSYHDEDGDTVVIDSDDSLKLAALSFQQSHVDVIKFYITLKNEHQTAVNHHVDTGKVQASVNRKPWIPCWHFQKKGSCSFGSSCTFLHHATPNELHHATCNIELTTSNKSGSLLDDSEIHEWLMARKRESEHDNISYLSSPEGFDSLINMLNHPHLPQIAINQLVRLLTRPLFRTSSKFRTSSLKQATNKIYNGFIGSQFLTALHSHIQTSVKPVLGCIEPYVFLCEEIVRHTSDGWKEVPLDELKTLVDVVENSLAIELSHVIMQLLDHRAKKRACSD